MKKKTFGDFTCRRCKKSSKRTASAQKYCETCKRRNELRNLVTKEDRVKYADRIRLLERTFIELTQHTNLSGKVVLSATIHHDNHLLECSHREVNRQDAKKERRQMIEEMTFWSRLLGVGLDVAF